MNLTSMELNKLPAPARDVEALQIHQQGVCRVLCLRLKGGAILANHVAPVPITLLVLSGRGELSTPQGSSALKPGQFLSLDAFLAHEIRASEDLTMVLTKFAATPAVSG